MKIIKWLSGRQWNLAANITMAYQGSSSGEQWPISRAVVEATYPPVAPLRTGEDGAYVKIALPVEARQTEQAERVTLRDGRGEILAQPGDWIVTAPDGRKWEAADGIFRTTYRVAG